MPKSDLPFDPDDYAPVAERIALFYARHPEGRIVTELLSPIESAEVVVRACVYRAQGDTLPAATGLASERKGDGDVNAVACLENTETSAIGRALANLGLTASRRRPSAEEMRKAARGRARLGREQAHAASAAPAQRTGRAAAGRRPRAVREAGPAYESGTEPDADVLADVRDLLDAAEREGLRPGRVQMLRGELVRGEFQDPQALERLEQALRRWLVRRRARSLTTEQRSAGDGAATQDSDEESSEAM